jgi:hypothetical protein
MINKFAYFHLKSFKVATFRLITFRFFTVIILMVSASGIQVNAQDLLRLKSGKEIKVTIIEENADIIKYREYEDQSGPVYSIAKNKVDTIKYKKGSVESREGKVNEPGKAATGKEASSLAGSGSSQLTVKKRYVYRDNVKLSSRNVKTIMEDNTKAINLYESGKKMCDLSNACAFGVIITSFIASSSANKHELNADKRRIGTIGLSIDGAFILTAIILSTSGKQKIRKSVSIYNAAGIKPVAYKLNIGIQENGLGVGLKF